MSREKLRVEIAAEELVVEITRVLRKLPYHCNAAKHLERSGDSVLFNLGEGVTAFKPRIKISKYDIARAEAREVQRAALALVLKGRLTRDDIAVLEDLADYIIASLTNMIKGLETRI